MDARGLLQSISKKSNTKKLFVGAFLLVSLGTFAACSLFENTNSDDESLSDSANSHLPWRTQPIYK